MDMDVSVITNMLPILGALVMRIVMAGVVLLVGWILAKWIAKLVLKLLQKTNLDNRIASSTAGDRVPRLEEMISQIVFYLLMLLVLVAVFEILGLALITQPLNLFLASVFAYLPNLLSAGILIVTAWIVAMILRSITRRILDEMNVDRHLGPEVDEVIVEKKSISKALSDAVYWLVWLVFLMPILQALGFESLVIPLTNMFNDVMSYVPNIIGALFVLAVGWFVARIVQRIVSSFLMAIGTDEFSNRIGLGKMLGKQNLSGVLGYIVFLLILLPVLMTSLEALGIQSLTQPLTSMLNQVFTAIPAILSAAIILILAYVGGKLLGDLVANLLEGLGFDNIMVTLGLAKDTTSWKVSPSKMVGHLVLFTVVMLAAVSAVSLLNMPVLSLVVTQFVGFVWHIIIGLVVFGLGLWLANFLASFVMDTDLSNRKTIATVARVAIIALATAMALKQMGLADSIINLAFGLTLGATALAAALAFGLGGREVAGRELDNWVNRIHKSD